jgi:hypothetical protein
MQNALRLRDSATHLRPRWRLVLLLALGALAATGQAPLGLWWLSILAFAGCFAVLPALPDWRAAAWGGWAIGAGYFALSLSWIVEPFLVDIARHGWMAPFALFGLAGGLALFWALAAGVAHATRGGALGLACALTLTEHLSTLNEPILRQGLTLTLFCQARQVSTPQPGEKDRIPLSDDLEPLHSRLKQMVVVAGRGLGCKGSDLALGETRLTGNLTTPA